MDQISELYRNDKTVGSSSRKRGPGWFSNPGPGNNGRNSGLFDPNAASRPSTNPHRYLPEITRQILLDSSDSESERFEPASIISGDGNDCECSEFLKNPRIYSHEPEPSLQSRVRSSTCRSEPIQPGSNLICESSSSNIPGPNLRFVPSPHPDMIHRFSPGSSKSQSAAESSRSWPNPVPSQFLKPHRFDCTHKLTSNAKSMDLSGNIVASPLPKSPFTFKTSSCVSNNTKKRLHSGSMVAGSRIQGHQWNTTPSGPFKMDHAISGRFDDETGPRPSSPYSNVEAIYTSNVKGILSSKNLVSQQASPSRVVNVSSEPITSKYNYGLSPRREVELGDPIYVSSSSQFSFQSIQVSNLNYADVDSSSCQDPGNEKTHPLTYQQTILHQTSSLGPEKVGFNCIVPGRSESGSTNPNRNISSSSITLATRQTSSFIGVGYSTQSYLRSNGSSGNKYSTGSGIVPSNQSQITTNPTNSVPSNQELCISSESSDSGVVVMSLVHKKNKIAGSSYNSSTGQVLLLESVTENFEFCTTVAALRSVLPSIVVLPSSSATRFVKELKAKIEGDQTLKDCQFQCLSPRYFAYSFARRTVLESSLWEGCVTFRSEDAKKNSIVSNINLNDERLVCAFGGLLYHLSTGCPQLGAGMSPPPITSVQHMKLSNKLWLDTESFKNLQIFDPAEHPSSFKWSSTNKEDGKSIFSLFERFCSSVGTAKLKSFLANPINCRRILEKRHEVMNFYLNHSNFTAVEALRSFTSQMSSSSTIVSYLSSPTLRGGHWKLIYRHIYYTVSYAEVCRSHGDQSELFREFGSTIVDAVYSMAHNLERVVNLVNMENNETFVIKYGFHPPLDAAKEKFSRLKMAMDKVTPYEFDSVPSFITRIQMMYIPEMKFLLSIPYWAPDLSKEELNLPNLEFKFTANKTVFYKSRRCYELDELLGDAQTDIINEESMIIQSLRNYLRKHMHHIVGMAQKIAEIECIFALAKVAREERYTKPEIVDSCVIDIRGGWHPLLDVPSNEVITNDMVSSADTNLVKLIFGPNASGKSIYLKQIGLIMYLVHVGSYVPAVSARVGLFGRILVRTAMEESVISMSSTMLSELKKLQDAVMGCAKDTLVILDEVGKCSTETNCIAIVTSAIRYFLFQGSNCPHVLISTHLSGISDFVPHSDAGCNLFELSIMDYTVTEGEIVFLFKIRRGSPDGSFVFEVLENCEYAAPVVKTAKIVLGALRTGEHFLPYCETRIERSHNYLNFIRKFVNIDMAKPGYLEKLQNKIQRYCEKPPNQ